MTKVLNFEKTQHQRNDAKIGFLKAENELQGKIVGVLQQGIKKEMQNFNKARETKFKQL